MTSIGNIDTLNELVDVVRMYPCSTAKQIAGMISTLSRKTTGGYLDHLHKKGIIQYEAKLLPNGSWANLWHISKLYANSTSEEIADVLRSDGSSGKETDLRNRLWRVRVILEDALPLDVEHNIEGHAAQLPDIYRNAIKNIERAIEEAMTPEDKEALKRF